MIYLGIRFAGNKYVVHPTTEQAFLNSKSKNEENIWYFTSEKSIDEFAIAGTFGTYDDQLAAKDAILSVDPNAQKVYVPPKPPDA